MTDVTFKIKNDLGSIGNGHKKLTVMSWNGGDYKFDIRDWYDNGNVGKGISLTKGELKSLYDLLADLLEVKDDDTVEDLSNILETDDESEIVEETVEEVEDENEIELEETTDDNIDNIFKKLDKLFKGFTTSKDYSVMPFAKESGKRIQYSVLKSKKDFPKYETTVEELGLKSYITKQGNLYIYTL